MKFKLFGKYKSFINSLATVEQKSFWIVGPVIVISGVLSITTSTAYSSYFAWAAIGLCISIPSIVMIACFKTKNYSVCYPMLCIGTAGVCLPITFLANGGFNSGMPIFCTAATILCTFCYEKKWRIISFISSYGLSLGVFFWARQGFEIIAPLDKNWVENDIIFSYAIVSVALFFCVDFILNEIHVYASGNEVLENYMDSKVRNELIVQASKGNLSVNGQARRVTVFFADINRFTTITERISPVQTAEFLNMYLSVAEKAIHKNDGILDKFIGDCVMAYWIDIDKNGKGVLSAVKTAFDMKKELREKAPEIFEKYGNELEFSTGIEYGDVILGSIGSSGRKEYTIIGDAVNTASRIQGQAKNGEVLISNNVYKVLKNKLEVSKAKDAIYLKGKNTPTIIYEVEGVVEGSVDGKVEKNIQLNNNEYTFYICGCRGKYPVSGMRFSQFGGETSCYILKKDKYAMVIDCGTGLVKSKDILKDCEKIDVLLTHVHYDHILGLLNKDVFPSNVKLRMFGHFGS